MRALSSRKLWLIGLVVAAMGVLTLRRPRHYRRTQKEGEE
jgi:hypothetical protein